MKNRNWIILLNLCLLLAYFVYSVAGKEKLLTNGKLVLLELAPVDPRSLMQGDYMQLRYKMATDNQGDSIPKRGFFVVVPDSGSVARKVRIQAGRQPLSAGELLIEYTAPNAWNISIGAESFFFQEGHAAKYDSAKYGGLRVDAEGNSLLVGLYDKDGKLMR